MKYFIRNIIFSIKKAVSNVVDKMDIKNSQEKPLEYDDFVETHEINSYQELLDIIQGKGDNSGLREDFIFRGLKKENYKLLPSSLRKNDDGELIINDHILNSDFCFKLNCNIGDAIKDGFIDFNDFNNFNLDGYVDFIINKYGKRINEGTASDFNDLKYINSKAELQFKRETYVLLKFLNYADKIGLKISVDEEVRRWIHNYYNYKYDNDTIWPSNKFFEIISLAQHHGLPTRALDWSYDYNVALYFAVEDVLTGGDNDCCLWAFNYNLFEKNYHEENYETHKLEIYRPEYGSNLNLNAQKGLFTFWTNKNGGDLSGDTPFDELVVKELIDKNCVDGQNDNEHVYFKFDGYDNFRIPDGTKIFHKFIISKDLKAEILHDLYLEGYAYENIYPNYSGVVNSIKYRAKLDEIYNKND